MYDVICYKNTGFSIGNTPDSPELLSGSQSVVLPITDLVQNRTLNSVRVRAENGYDNIKDVDYCKIGDAYYWVTNVTMLAVDVARLDLVIDALLSVGGYSSLTIISGTVQRGTTPTDGFGEWTAPEPITPRNPLQLVIGNVIGDSSDSKSSDTTLIASTIDLATDKTDATTYTDPTNTDNIVTVPEMPPAIGDNLTVMQIGPEDTDKKFAWTPMQRYYDANNEKVRNNVAKARGLNQEGGIIGQWVIPSAYIKGGKPSITDDGLVSNLTSAWIDESSGLNFEYKTVKNKKLLYGSMNAYQIISVGSGNEAEFSPEDIRNADEPAPNFVVFSDLRMGQKPFCRPKYYLKDSQNIYQNCVPGQEWANAPLVYYDKSGSTLDRIAFNAEREIQAGLNQRTIYETAGISAGGGATGMFSAVGGWVNRALAGAVGLSGMAEGVINAGVPEEYRLSGSQMYGAAKYAATGDISNAVQDMANEYKKASIGFGSSQVVAPNIQFPRADALRDYFGNGFLIIRRRPSDKDIEWMDQWYTMMGYDAQNAPLTMEWFNSRTYFNYVVTGDAEFGGNIPFYMRELLSAQLRGGIRIWHVRPDVSYYKTGNPIKGGTI